MDFKTQQNFHPVRSDIQPLPPGKRRLPLQPTPWPTFESSLLLTLFPQRAGVAEVLCHGVDTSRWWGCVSSGEAGRRGSRKIFTTYLWGSVDPDLVLGGGVVTGLLPAPAANSRHSGGFKGHVTPTRPLSTHCKHLAHWCDALSISMAEWGGGSVTSD